MNRPINDAYSGAINLGDALACLSAHHVDVTVEHGEFGVPVVVAKMQGFDAYVAGEVLKGNRGKGN